MVARSDRIFIFGYDAAGTQNSINVKEKANEKAASYSSVNQGYFKDTQNTGLEQFTKNDFFQAEEIEAYALI